MINNELQHFLKALTSEKRQEIMILFLDRNEVSVNQVAEIIGISQSNASEQLSILKKAGLLVSRREGKEVFYSTNKPKIMELMQNLNKILIDSCQYHIGNGCMFFISNKHIDKKRYVRRR